MPERSPTAATAVSLAFLLAGSALLWTAFGALAVSVMRNLAGG